MAPASQPKTNPRRNRVDDVHRALLRLIEGGELATGDRLPTEIELTKSFGVSRPVVREAIARLMANGHVQTERGKGSFVTDANGLEHLSLSPITSVEDLLAWQELRVAIEQEAARLAATRHTEHELRQLERLHAAMVEQPHRDGHIGGDDDYAFHMAIASAAHNRAIHDAQKVLGRHIKRWISAVLQLEPVDATQRQRHRLSEHEAIVSAIRNREPDRAAEAVRLHIENGRTRFLARITRIPNRAHGAAS